MSNVKEGDRGKSKAAFDNAYHKILADSIFLTDIKFGASEEQKIKYSTFLDMRCRRINVIVRELKLEVNEKKTHIVKLTHGFTFMQIKYHVKDGKIIKRPTHNKIVRERRRLKKFKKKYDNKEMTELQISNCYRSWRNTVVKDYNACSRTIESLDKLYDSLFPNKEIYIKASRKDLIDKTYRDSFEEKYTKYIIGGNDR